MKKSKSIMTTDQQLEVLKLKEAYRNGYRAADWNGLGLGLFLGFFGALLLIHGC